MWELIKDKYKFIIIVVPSVLLYLLFNSILEQSVIRSISYTTTLISILSFLIGKYLWKYVYIDFFKKNICPDFNGVWIGEIVSNFDSEKKILIPIEINADFFGVKLKSNTTVGYSYANYCQIIRTDSDQFELEYIFRTHNHSPSETDTTYYEGAVKVIVTDIDSMTMTGLYWTNRCWQNGKNTAGTITFKKSDKTFNSINASISEK
ncbi:hypothetical protein [Vibrio atlanticus]|uniref:CD-NTase-associated protein 15 domain-containing protein n=1 Tax=Vibrio atlanticus (strain LGP32) TaxID=575788 RepID=B7VPJ7_VIBA3|nr:hypothetical protein [Vibrio atlanticus]CAV18947.1 hypothetical protein VS_1763 [Vibrio atlanticus]